MSWTNNKALEPGVKGKLGCFAHLSAFMELCWFTPAEDLVCGAEAPLSSSGIMGLILWDVHYPEVKWRWGHSAPHSIKPEIPLSWAFKAVVPKVWGADKCLGGHGGSQDSPNEGQGGSATQLHAIIAPSHSSGPGLNHGSQTQGCRQVPLQVTGGGRGLTEKVRGLLL